MIRRLVSEDFLAIHALINEAARKYEGVILADRYHEPYMLQEELAGEIESGVDFYGLEADGELLGVMGVQDAAPANASPVTLIRHAYVRPSAQKQGVGGRLLLQLQSMTDQSTLVGTWADAYWAIGFYGKHGFINTAPEDKTRLLRTYWSIPDRQVETSVVLADAVAVRDLRLDSDNDIRPGLSDVG